MRFGDDDPFFSEVSNLIDVIEDIEEDPEAAQILSSYEGPPAYSAAGCLILMTFFFRCCPNVRVHMGYTSCK
jgi:hypothetical protein